MYRLTTVIVGSLLAIAVLALGTLSDVEPPLPAAGNRSSTFRDNARHLRGPEVLAANDAAAADVGPAQVTTAASPAAPAADAPQAPAPLQVPALQFVLSGRCTREGVPVPRMKLRLFRQGSNEPVQLVHTDAAGRFRRALQSAGDYVLTPIGDGLSAHQQPFSAHVERRVPCELGNLVLLPRVQLSGRLLHADGTPAAGVEVRARTVGSDAELTPATTAADGAFAFADVPPGRIALSAGAGRGRAARSIDCGDTALAAVGDMVLRGHLQLRGNVRDDDGAAIADAQLTVLDATQGDPARADAAPADDESECARSDGDGTFALDLPVGCRLRVEASGCRTTTFAPGGEDPIELVLPRLWQLAGRIDNAGAGAQVRLQPTAAATPAAASVRLPVDADGGFAFADLTRGDYWLAASGANGRAPARVVAVPSDRPIELHLCEGQPFTLVLRDDLDRPIAFAGVHLASGMEATADSALARAVLGSEPDGATGSVTSWRSDADGRVEATAPPGQDVIVALAARDYLPTAARFGAATVAAGQPLQLTAGRATVIRGRITGFTDRGSYDLSVLAWQRGGSAQQAQRLEIADDGTFQSGPVLAGAWQVALARQDRTGRSAAEPGGADDMPLLGAGIDTRTTTIVDAPHGGQTDLLVPVPPIARIDGRVVQHDRGAAGVAVFAVPAGDDGKTWRTGNQIGFDAANAHEFAPHTRTDEQGRFTLLVARPGAFDLRARHRGQPTALAPVRVVIESYTALAQATLSLPTALVRGRFGRTSRTADAGRHLGAYLYPAADAALDPFAAGANALADADCRLRLPLAANGAFTFVAVPPGTYVLRLCSPDRIVLQRAVVVGADPVDLGDLGAPKPLANTAVPLAPRPARLLRGHVRAVLPGVPSGAFARAVDVAGAVPLDDLPTGRYLVQLFAPGADGDQPLGEPQPIERNADGTTVPARLALPR